MAILATLAALIQCPAWCTLPVGHGPDLIEPSGTVFRTCRAEVLPDAGGHRIALQQCAIVDPDGTVEAIPPQVTLDGETWLGVDQTRRLVAGLALASELAAVGGVR